jgi:hypothetical protein
MAEEVQSWRDVSQMLQGLMREAEGRVFTGDAPGEAPAHQEEGVGQERPPPELGSLLLRRLAGGMPAWLQRLANRRAPLR